MNADVLLAATALAFVGSHFALSHPWRRVLVGRFGERGFLGVYALVGVVTFGAFVVAARRAASEPPMWVADDLGWAGATVVMLAASLLLAGSVVGNPALAGAPAVTRDAAPRGVLAITRHPMMWAFALWAATHAVLWGSTSNLIVAAGIGGLALFGAWAQDARKARRMEAGWAEWTAKTAFWPFAAQISQRSPWRTTLPRAPVLVAGTALWLLATAAHRWAGGPLAGPWRWIG